MTTSPVLISSQDSVIPAKQRKSSSALLAMLLIPPFSNEMQPAPRRSKKKAIRGHERVERTLAWRSATIGLHPPFRNHLNWTRYAGSAQIAGGRLDRSCRLAGLGIVAALASGGAENCAAASRLQHSPYRTDAQIGGCDSQFHRFPALAFCSSPPHLEGGRIPLRATRYRHPGAPPVGSRRRLRTHGRDPGRFQHV